MLNNINIGRYYNTKSIIHNLHPLVKIIMLILATLLSLIANVYINIVLLMIVIILLILSNIKLKHYFKAIYSLKIIILSLLIVNIIFSIDIEKIINAVLRLIIIVNLSSLLTYTTQTSNLTHGLEMFFSPLKLFKVPVNELALSVTLAIRFIPTLIEQSNKILKSQASRGIDYNNAKLKGKLVIINSMIFPLINVSLKKANDLSDVMEVRLYDINAKRTYNVNKINTIDLLVILITIMIFIVGVIL